MKPRQGSTVKKVAHQMSIRSTSSSEISSPRRSYRPVVRADSCAAICCATSSLPPFFQVRGNSGCAERVAPDQGFYSRTTGAAPDHEVDLRLGDTAFRELLRLALGRAEQGSAFLAGDARGLDVRRHVLFQVVMRRHFVALAALLVEAHPPAAPLKIPIFDIHARCGAHARERVDHQGDERTIAEADDERCDLPGLLILPPNGNAVEENPSLVGREHRRLAFLHAVPRPADRMRGVRGDHLAGHQPIKEHPDSGELLLYRWPRKFFAEFFDIRRDMHRTDPLERETSRSAPAKKLRATRDGTRAACSGSGCRSEE